MALGLWLSRGQKSKRDYFLSDRDLSFWVVGLSIVATETSALTFIGVPALAIGELRLGSSGRIIATGGSLLFMQIVIGYVLARVIVVAIMVPHYFRGDVYTPYQLLSRAFGPMPRYVAASLAVVNMCLQAGFRVYVSSIPLVLVLRATSSSLSIWHAMVLLVLVAVLSCALGGIRAVVWTDVVQFFVFFGGGLFILLYIPTLLVGDHSAPSGATAWAALLEVGRERLTFFNWGVAARGPGQGVLSWIGATIAKVFGGEFNIWMGLVGATVGVMVSHGADQLNVQRVLACKDAADGKKALLLSAAIIAPQFLMFLFIGVGLYVYYTLGGFSFGTIQPWDPGSAIPLPKADYVLAVFIMTVVPPLARGLLVAAILAAALSSLTSALTALSSVAVMDILRPLLGTRGHRATELRSMRLATLLSAVALTIIAGWAKDAPLIFNVVFQFAGIFSGAKLGALLFAMSARRGHEAPVIAGMLASATVMAFIVFATRAGVLRINWPWYPFIGCCICLAVARFLARLAPPAPDRDIDRPSPDEP